MEQFIKFLDHSDALRGIFSVIKIKKMNYFHCVLKKQCEMKMYRIHTRNLISIRSISPPIRSTIFSPCSKINASNSSTVLNCFTSYRISNKRDKCCLVYIALKCIFPRIPTSSNLFKSCLSK